VVISAMEALPPGRIALEGLYTALEHEAMHQETLLYMWHRLPYEQKRGAGREIRGADDRGARFEVRDSSRRDGHARAALPRTVAIPAGDARLGAERSETAFGWDNEFDRHFAHVPAFDIDVLPVTNAEFLEFVNAAGYSRRELWSEEGWEWVQSDRVAHPAFWLPESRTSSLEPRTSDLGAWRWRAMFSSEPLPPQWPVYVSHAEAAAYARWKGRRLMTEPEFHRAAEGATPGHVDFAGFDPIPVGSLPQTASVSGVHDLIGNGWEWTSTVFGPFDGFAPMPSYPEYSADFFDGRHYVLKGGSPATAIELTRPSFRNWFRGNYPYVYAKFRTVGGNQ